MSEKATLFGEVVAADGNEVQVRLDTEELAVLRNGDVPLRVGDRGEFTLEGRSPDGRTIVSVTRPRGNAEDATAFDLEFDRLHSALSGRRTERRPQPTTEAAPRSLHGEMIRSWIERVGVTLSQLRKHRTKRSIESDES